MAKINDGGPAFPHPAGWRRDPEISDGMSLRDWFAGQALAGILGASPPPFCEDAAEDAYRYADAMLAERSRGEG